VSLRNILNTYGGVCPRVAKQLIEELTGCDPTFSELKRKIYVSSYNLKRSQTEYFSSDTHPNMKVIDAVYKSCSIPFVFGCLDMYVDGGLCEKLPIAPFLQHRNEEVYIIETTEISEPDDINDFISYASCITKNLIMNRVDYLQYTQRIRIPISMTQVVDFKMSQEDKLKLYIKGFKENIISL
jgi:predicted acylesterase/phospholipase RssA